ncbi:NADP-dependent malic enzyme [Candidatus Micrarchaeota archaeon]|nr:NADP-dependent malic enzyme [Candidatus Micrarchaeota archaeon]
MDPLEFHKKYKGKIGVNSRVSLNGIEALSLAYTPGVAKVCEEIHKKPETVYDYTMKNNFVAIINDGTRILGLGDIGPEAGLPVMEGKAALFREFGGVDAVPISLKTKDKDEIVRITQMIEPSFGGINLEDIETPKVFEIYDELVKTMDVPIFHDDRHGTGIVAMAGLINAMKVAGKEKNAEVVLIGAGAAIMGIMELLLAYGMENLTVLDSKGVLDDDRKDIEEYKKWFVEKSKPKGKGGISDVLKGADIVIAAAAGSAKDIITKEMIQSMNKNAIVFTLRNPIPEISYEDAREAGARVVATGRSDYPNQANNVLVFPGLFRGALDVRAKEINLEMMIAAAEAVANSVKVPNENKILPLPFEKDVAENVAIAVAEKAVETGVARIKLTKPEIKEKVCERLLCHI